MTHLLHLQHRAALDEPPCLVLDTLACFYRLVQGCTSQLWMRTVLDSDGSLPVGGPTARSNSRMQKAVIGGPKPGVGNGSREGAHQCSSASSQGVQGAADMHKHQNVSKKGSFLDEFISTWLYACPFQPVVEAVPCGATNRFWGQQPGRKRHKKW